MSQMMLPPDPEYVFIGDMDSILCITSKFKNNEGSIFAGTQTGKVHIWNLKTKRQTSSFNSGEDACISIYISEEEENDITITQNKSGEISFWKENNSQWSCISSIKTNFFGFCKSVVFEDILYTSLKDCGCQMISIKTKQTISITKLSQESDTLGDIMALKVMLLNGETHMLVAYEGQKLILWAKNDFKKISSLEMTECPMAVDFDVKANRGICGNPSNEMIIFSIDKNLKMKIDKTVALVNAGVAAVQIRPDSKVVAVGCWDGKLRLYSWKTLTLLAVLDIHSSTVQDVGFLTNLQTSGKTKYLMVAGSKDKKISLWDLYN